MRARGFEVETRFVDDKPSPAWVNRFLKRHRMRWKRATKLGEARQMALTPGNVSATFREWRHALVKVAFDMWRVYCWDQTPLETDLPRRVRFRAVGMVGSDQQPVVRGRTTIGGGFVLWLAIGCMGQVLHPVVIFKGGSKEVADYVEREPGKLVRLAEQAAALDDGDEMLDEADAQLVEAALRAENRELARCHDIPQHKRGRLARFAPAQFPIECSRWGFLKQPNGATDTCVADEAFRFFAQQIEHEHPDDGWKVVVMDNLGAHRNADLLQQLLDHHILPLFIPPNSTHRLMPLDRVFNGVLKHYYNSELRDCIGAGIMPNNRVILTCVSRALDRICPDVTKASWRGFFPYDRASVVSEAEQRNALKLKRHVDDADLYIDETDTDDDLPDTLRREPRVRPLPPRPLRRHRFAFEPNQDDEKVESDGVDEEDEHVEVSELIANLDDVRAEMGLPFRRQKLLGGSRKSFAAIGLITPQRLDEEQDRVQRYLAEERQRKEERQALRRQRSLQQKKA